MPKSTFQKRCLLLDGLALLAGLAGPLAFAPFHEVLFALCSPLVLLITWLDCSRTRATWRGFLFGLGFFGIGASWVFVSIHTYAHTSTLLAVFLTTLFIVLLAAFFALQGFLLHWLFPYTDHAKCVLGFPMIWVGCELLRTYLLSGFPWLLLGYAVLDTPLGGFAPWVGVYGLSALTALCAAIFVSMYLGRHRHLLLGFLTLVIIWNLGDTWLQNRWTHPAGKPLHVALVQGNVEQSLKWNRHHLRTILNHYETLTTPHWGADLIVWPEGAVPLEESDAYHFLHHLSQQTKAHHTHLITGIPISDEESRYYNAALLIGKTIKPYQKKHLVPFGEYTPMQSFFAPLMQKLAIPFSSLSKGPDNQPVWQMGNLRIAPFICYEIAYPGEVLSSLNHANLIVNLTDDSWFGHSIAAAQQLQIAQMRAKETGLPVLAATNNGLTAIVSETGDIQAALTPFESGVLTAVIQPMQGTTPLQRFGITRLCLLMALLLGTGLVLSRRSNHGRFHEG